MSTGARSPKAQKLIEAARVAASRSNNPAMGDLYLYAIEKQLDGDNTWIEFMKNLSQMPVDIETFIDSPEFLGATDLSLWPKVRETIVNLNRNWWKGPGKGSEYAYNELVCCGATGCVDMDTEYLTPTGWKRIADFVEGDTVGQYHADGSLTFVKPIEYVNMEYPMFFHFKTASFDQYLTPGHRVIYRSRKTGRLMEKAAEDIVGLHNGSKYGWAAGEFIGDYTYSGEGLALSDDEIRLMVAVMADGSFYKRAGHHPNYCVFHVKREDKKERLRSLLDICGIAYNEYDRMDGFSDISFRAPERNKTYEGWWSASQHQLQIIADEVLRWDGTIGRDEFYTRDKHSADFIQHVFSTTGRRTTINVCEREDGIDYVVHIVKSGSWGIASTTKQEISIVDSPDGRCYCFRLPTGMWLSRRNGKVVVTGNTGKSEISKVTTAYHLHILGCLKEPHKLYGLPSATSIVMVIQAAKPHVTKKVIYTPLRNYIETMPWFQKHMRPEKLIESEMYFSHLNIRVVQGGSDSDTILGEAIIGAVLDEINFMNVVENSKKANVGSGRSGVYDQAQMVYDAVHTRRQGRFLYKGPQIGMIVCSSSTRYNNDFTDRRCKYVEDNKDNPRSDNVYIYNYAQYEVKPAEGRYSGEKFLVWVGNDAAADIRVIEDGLPPPDGNVFEVPIEYIDNFRKNPAISLRDIVGRSVNSVSPFIRRRNKIMEAVELGAQSGLESFLTSDNVTLAFEGIPMPVRGHYCRNPSKPRYVHIDLSNTGDRCGIAMLRFDGMEYSERGDGHSELLPIASVELAVGIEPDHGFEIDIAEIRTWVKMLKTQYGYPIRAVTYDGWNCVSEDTQIWTSRGMLRAGDVEVGDIVQTRSGPQPVEKVWNYGEAPTLIVTTQHGHSIEMTGKHKVEALSHWSWEDGKRIPNWVWVRADNLEEGQVIRRWLSDADLDVDGYQKLQSVSADGKHFRQPLRMTEEVAKAIGLLHGDGSFGKGYFILTCDSHEREEAIEILQDAFDFENELNWRQKDDSNGYSIQPYNTSFMEWLKVNGLDCKYSVPEIIKRSPSRVQAAFVSGLLAADGSVKKRDGQVSLETISKEYAEYVCNVASMLFGMTTNITTRTDREVTLPQGDTTTVSSYVVQFTGSRHDFLHKIGIAYDCKESRVAEHIDVAGRTIFSKVAKIEESSAVVVDFQVRCDHSYVANGFVSHNSLESRQAWRKQGMKTGAVSVDRTSTPYKTFRDALYDGRIKMYQQDILLTELYDLEYDERKDKIDHPVTGSKDVADAVCGAYYNLITRSESWSMPMGAEDEPRYDDDYRLEEVRV